MTNNDYNAKWQCFVITPDGTGVVTEAGFADIQKLVGGYVQIVPNSKTYINVLVNEDGLPLGLSPNPFATFVAGAVTGLTQNLVGTVVFVGDDAENETFDDLHPGVIEYLSRSLALIQTM